VDADAYPDTGIAVTIQPQGYEKKGKVGIS
jgi:hypothetical protein